ncbi:hypothetical protein M758_4G266700 [Ceratodon purpureus]|nr:hypothetical protein M758_4G266700 [Ceratodon purpureus]
MGPTSDATYFRVVYHPQVWKCGSRGIKSEEPGLSHGDGRSHSLPQCPTLKPKHKHKHKQTRKHCPRVRVRLRCCCWALQLGSFSIRFGRIIMAMALAQLPPSLAHAPRSGSHHLSSSCWRFCSPALLPMGQPPPLEPRHGLALMPAVALVTTTLGGRLCITYADPSHGFTNKITKKENRVFPIFSQKQDGEYSTAQLSARNRISGSRSFVGTLLEKALVVFVKSQLDDCEDLRVAVGGSNWDLLGGNVRTIEVSATKAIYKGVIISEVGLAARNVRAKLGRKRLFQYPFRVNANIRIREQDFNSSLASPLMLSSFKDILPRNSEPLRVQYDNGNLRFSSSDKQSGRYGQVEYPITLRVGVQNGGEVISVESSKSDSLKKTFQVGPEAKITDFQVGSSWLSLTGEFLLMP